MVRAEIAIAGAAIGGSALIALVLWHGLGRIADAIEASPVQQSSVILPVPAPPRSSSAPVTVSPERSAEDWQTHLRDLAQNALAKQQPDYVRACWKPSRPGQPPDFGGGFELDIDFDASGNETGRKVRSVGTARSELTECVSRFDAAPLRIAPLGSAGTATVNMPIP